MGPKVKDCSKKCLKEWQHRALQEKTGDYKGGNVDELEREWRGADSAYKDQV